MLSDKQWAALGPLMEACRPHAKVPSPHLRRTMEAILWRHQNGVKWRSLPGEFGRLGRRRRLVSGGRGLASERNGKVERMNRPIKAATVKRAQADSCRQP